MSKERDLTITETKIIADITTDRTFSKEELIKTLDHLYEKRLVLEIDDVNIGEIFESLSEFDEEVDVDSQGSEYESDFDVDQIIEEYFANKEKEIENGS